MGFITQLEDGQYYIEDLSGSLKADLSEAMTAAGFYVGMYLLTSAKYWQMHRHYPVYSPLGRVQWHASSGLPDHTFPAMQRIAL